MKPAPVADARRSAAAIRIGLVILAVSQGGVGGWALVAPGGFFSGFPVPGHPWVAKLPPYNEHLIRDVGSLSLALTVIFVAAAVTLDRRLAAASVTAFGVYAVPHLIFHVLHLDGFSRVDAVLQTGGLVVQLAVAAALAGLLAGDRRGR